MFRMRGIFMGRSQLAADVYDWGLATTTSRSPELAVTRGVGPGFYPSAKRERHFKAWRVRTRFPPAKVETSEPRS